MPITILVVDDSEVIRFLFTKSLEREPDFRVVGTANNGVEAIEMAKKHQPDIVLLDIEMPQMDGLTALPGILASSGDTKIFIISGDSRDSATKAVKSLSLGASDFLLKPGSAGALPSLEFHEELRNKIKAIARPRAWRAPAETPGAPSTTAAPNRLAPVTMLRKPFVPQQPTEPGSAAPTLIPAKHTEIHALAIASSTGGPEALIRLFGDLKGRLAHLPIFVTQHMPPVFTTALAEQISRNCQFTCREAIDGEKVAAGIIYIAPGGHHMLTRVIAGSTVIQLTQTAPINSCRPSADPMFASISHVYGRNTLGVVLTGIGADGCQGARAIVDNGGSIIAQDKATSVVYGMPKAVADAGLCEAIVPIEQMASSIIRRCGLRYA
jgi:two-component system, chemotaxis family, protein-glutamate methylesterase/glutaminase